MGEDDREFWRREELKGGQGCSEATRGGRASPRAADSSLILDILLGWIWSVVGFENSGSRGRDPSPRRTMFNTNRTHGTYMTQRLSRGASGIRRCADSPHRPRGRGAFRAALPVTYDGSVPEPHASREAQGS